MWKFIQILILLFMATMFLAPTINAIEPQGSTPPLEGDLIAIDIDIWFEEQICYAVITVQNNDPNRTVTTNFWVQLKQDTQDGRYLGEVYVTEDLSPGEWYTTDPIIFYPQSGLHWL
ncbi:MAG: hypothetical protein ACQXXF_08260 [Thermoplasmatota archaeon]